MALRPLRHRRPHPRWATQRSTPTRPAPPPQGSGYGPRPSTPSAGSPARGSLTDNGPCYRSSDFAKALKDTRTSPRRTRAYRPQTNGKVERFHRTLNEEWAYARDWDNDTQRCDAHQRFMHYYNEHRPHGALKWDTPMATLTRLSGDNVLGMHI